MGRLFNRNRNLEAAWKVIDKDRWSVTAAEIEAVHRENKTLLGVKADTKVSKTVGSVRRAAKGSADQTQRRTLVLTFVVGGVDVRLRRERMVDAQNAYRASCRTTYTLQRTAQNLDA